LVYGEKAKMQLTKNTLLFTAVTMYGVEYAMAKLKSQFVAVVIDKHRDRTLSGKSSPVTTQATGPQELAKKNM
jgi:hypothetical protein